MTIVYIDGQNFMYKAAEILISHNLISDKQELTKLNFHSLFNAMFPEENLEIRYYGVTKIRCRKDYGIDIYDKSLRFSDCLRRIQNHINKQKVKYIPVGRLNIKTGDVCKYCDKYDYHFQEKGVDVGLAVDIVRDAIKGDADKIILVSSDTDLIPAVRAARSEGAKVHYVGFEQKLTRALVDETDHYHAIKNKTIIENYLNENQKAS